MTDEQPPSAEALEIADSQPLAEVLRLSLARDIDVLIAQRVSAETERWEHRDRQRLEQIATLQEAVQSFQSARDERPAHAAAVDHTERAREAYNRALATIERDRDIPGKVIGPSTIIAEIAAALSAVASERDAASASLQQQVEDLEADAGNDLAHRRSMEESERQVYEAIGIERGDDNWPEFMVRLKAHLASEREAAAIRAFGRRVWSDIEEVAYQAGVSDTLDRFQEPDEELVMKLARVICPQRWSNLNAGEEESEKARARAALTKIAEMLK